MGGVQVEVGGWAFGESKRAVNRVGEALARGPLNDNEEGILRRFEAYCDQVRLEVDDRLRALGFLPTSRPKTRRTLLEKLQRGGFPLVKVQDIVGTRIVLAADQRRFAQYEAMRTLVRQLNDLSPKVHDRIESPSHGYRALHVVVSSRGISMEVQIRTQYQHQWAEVYEALADVLGREIRYGHGVDAARVGPDRVELAESVVRQAMIAAELVNVLEEFEFMVDAGDVAELGTAEIEGFVREAHADVERALEDLRRRASALDGLLR